MEEPKMSLADALVMDLEAEAAPTRKMLAAVPGGKFDWRPHERSWTLAELASHIAESPTWLTSMGEDEMDFAAMEDYRPFVAGDPGELTKAFDDNLAGALEFVRGKDDAFLERTWTMRMGEKVLMQQPKASVIRQIGIHHLIHHRGQLSVYLRLLDVPLPPVYGPTADHPDFQ
ncbi:MAG: DinB family protein [Planctomycetota bacterium JB042]